MLKHRGLKTLLTHGFLLIMMVINEAALSSLEILATGMISQQLFPSLLTAPYQVIMMLSTRTENRGNQLKEM